MTGISQPGIYDIPIDVYHSQACCDGPSASSSTLRQIVQECPARVYAYSDLNPNKTERKESKAFNFGRAAHFLMLGEPEFDRWFVVAPHDNFVANPGRIWHEDWKENVAKGRERRTLIRLSDMDTVKAMVAAQRRSPECARAFIEGASERSLVWKDEETGIWLKSRPDWLPHEPAKRFLTEYKTTESANPRTLSNAVFKYGYEMQAALALEGVEKVLQVAPLGFAHVVQEKDPPYIAELRLFTPEQTDFGFRQNRKALRIFARCIETGVWPGWTVGPSYYQTPYYIGKIMEEFTDEIGDGTHESYSQGEYLVAG